MSRRLEPKKSAPIFAALGDPIRLELVTRLCRGGPMSIAKLAEGFDVTRQAVTKHLVVLESAGVVSSRRQGREVLWELESTRLEEAKKWLDVISQQWDEALNRLKAFVEND
jgi:DNA-binding transcriptional ArsR family regulator